MTHDRQKAHRRGQWAEHLAGLCLRLKGYRILKNRYKTSKGEIDLIAKRGHTIAFVEVKARSTAQDGLQAISSHQQNRIKRAAELYIIKHPRYRNFDLRFDAMVILPKRLPIHLENAW